LTDEIKGRQNENAPAVWKTAGAKKYDIYLSKNIISKKWRFVNNSAGYSPHLTLDKSINEPTKRGYRQCHT
jgi:hypothetical protein